MDIEVLDEYGDVRTDLRPDWKIIYYETELMQL